MIHTWCFESTYSPPHLSWIKDVYRKCHIIHANSQKESSERTLFAPSSPERRKYEVAFWASIRASIPIGLVISLTVFFAQEWLNTSPIISFGTRALAAFVILGILGDVVYGLFFSGFYVKLYRILPSRNPITKSLILSVVAIALLDFGEIALVSNHLTTYIEVNELWSAAFSLSFGVLFAYLYSRSSEIFGTAQHLTSIKNQEPSD